MFLVSNFSFSVMLGWVTLILRGDLFGYNRAIVRVFTFGQMFSPTFFIYCSSHSLINRFKHFFMLY